MSAEELADLPGVSPSRTHQIVPGALVAEACMDIFDLTELEICPWALREGVILERLDQISVTGCTDMPSSPLIGLSTASVYPESTAHAFGWAAQLGYDAVEVMVGIDALSQQIAAVKQLSDHHEMPICAVHAPCLLFTQRVWGTEPWGKLERSAEMADAVGADVVVVHPPFRWQKEYAAGFVEGIAALEESTGIAFAVENMYPWRASSRRGMEMYLPGWDPVRRELRQHHDRPLPRGDRPQSTSSRWPSGSATGCATSTSPTAPARPRTSTSCPAAARWAPRRSCATSPRSGFSGHVVLEINTRRRASTERARGRPAGVAGVRPRALRRDRRHEPPGDCPARSARPAAGAPEPPTPGPRSSPPRAASFAEKGFRGTTIRAVAAAAGVDPALVHHYFGSKDDLFLAALEMPVDPREVLAPVVAGGLDGAGERLLRAFLSAWDDPEIQVRLLAVVRSVLSEDGATLLNEGFIPVVVGPVPRSSWWTGRRCACLSSPARSSGSSSTRYLLALPPMAEMSADDVVARVGPVLQHYLTGDLP